MTWCPLPRRTMACRVAYTTQDLPRRREAYKRPRVPRNHQIFVRRDDPDRADAGRRADGRGVGGVAPWVEPDPEMVEPLTDLPADWRRSFPDAARKDQHLHAAQDSREGAEILADRRAEHLDSLGRSGIALPSHQQGLHVRRGRRDAEEARLFVEEMLKLRCAVALLTHQIEKDARVEISAARAHHDATERRDA